MANSARFEDEVSIVLCGEAGKGIQTIEQLLTPVLKNDGYAVFSTKEYMSRVRGGSNSTEIRVSSKKGAAYVERIDILVPLDGDAISHLKKRISEKTIIIADKNIISNSDEGAGRVTDVLDVPFAKIAESVGNRLYANSVAIGFFCGLFSVEKALLDAALENQFGKKTSEIIAKNKEAAKRGYEIGASLLSSKQLDIAIKKHAENREALLMNGAEAVAYGALAGGCNFISSYPMTPGTSVLVALAQQSQTFDIVVEQAEDEISAINMALGAWYAGARAMITTSGGGFSLMIEGISLAGMLESPVVVHLGQRPGPATGLPTRTEQGDLNLALYAGHGEFPRIILAPGTLEDAFYVSQRAFSLAAKFQVPVFILTDQYFTDSYYTMPGLELSALKNESHVVETKAEYRRYALTDDGVSPRGVPSFGEGLVVADSDEHDEEGHITENLDTRVKMVEKRLRKLDAIKKDIIPPEFSGSDTYTTLIIGWGSTYHAIREALDVLGRDDIAFLHFKQAYPVYPRVGAYTARAKKIIVIEENAAGQFAALLKRDADVSADELILKYDGLPFSVEELVERLGALVTEAKQ